jgi:hypothetical protein
MIAAPVSGTLRAPIAVARSSVHAYSELKTRTTS